MSGIGDIIVNVKIDDCFACRFSDCPHSGYFLYTKDYKLCLKHGSVLTKELKKE